MCLKEKADHGGARRGSLLAGATGGAPHREHRELMGRSLRAVRGWRGPKTRDRTLGGKARSSGPPHPVSHHRNPPSSPTPDTRLPRRSSLSAPRRCQHELADAATPASSQPLPALVDLTASRSQDRIETKCRNGDTRSRTRMPNGARRHRARHLAERRNPASHSELLPAMARRSELVRVVPLAFTNRHETGSCQAGGACRAW